MVLNNVKGFDGPYEAPLKLPSRKVLKSWIDYNGHMNVAYYTRAIDNSIDYFLEEILGIGETHAITSRKKNVGIFFLVEKRYVLIIIPIKAPWKDIPPSQTFIISTGFEI